MNRALLILVVVLVLAYGYFAGRSLANPKLVPLPSPTSAPSYRIMESPQPIPTPNVWALQTQVSALQTQMKALQSQVQSEQNTIASLQQSLSSLQQAFNNHYHTFTRAIMGIDTIPQMYCTTTGSGGQCWSTGELTIYTTNPQANGSNTTTEATSGPLESGPTMMKLKH
jgi:hypothetical protein